MFDDLEVIAFFVLGAIALVCVTACVCSWDKSEPLPPPHNDPRDWTGAFMRDWKRR